MIDTEWHRADGDERPDHPRCWMRDCIQRPRSWLGHRAGGRTPGDDRIPACRGCPRCLEVDGRGRTSRSWMPKPCVSIMVRSDRRGAKRTIKGPRDPSADRSVRGLPPQLEDGHIRHHERGPWWRPDGADLDLFDLDHSRRPRRRPASTRRRQPPAAPRSRLSERALNSIVESSTRTAPTTMVMPCR